jgi:hypothetical protein
LERLIAVNVGVKLGGDEAVDVEAYANDVGGFRVNVVGEIEAMLD